MTRSFYRATLCAWIAVVFLAAVATGADDGLPLKVTEAWVRAVPPVADGTAAFMTLVNDGDMPLRLTGGSTPIAKSVAPMITTKKEVSGTEVVGMEGVDALVVPAHGRCELKPGGNHLMIMGLVAHPKAGDTIKLTLRFDPGGKEITLDVPVR